jgi:hypothetical protein
VQTAVKKIESFWIARKYVSACVPLPLPLPLWMHVCMVAVLFAVVMCACAWLYSGRLFRNMMRAIINNRKGATALQASFRQLARVSIAGDGVDGGGGGGCGLS